MNTNLLEIESNSGAHMIVDGREILNFTGCCYLGLCAEPSLIQAGTEAIERYGSLGQIPQPLWQHTKALSRCRGCRCRFF